MSKGGVEFEYEEEESEPEEAAQAEGEGDPIAAQYTSFFILGYHNPIRAGCRWVAESKVSFSKSYLFEFKCIQLTIFIIQ